MSSTEGEGTYCFWCGSYWRRRQRQRQRRRQRDSFLFARNLMNQWVDYN